jgi:hypothetical protein
LWSITPLLIPNLSSPDRMFRIEVTLPGATPAGREAVDEPTDIGERQLVDASAAERHAAVAEHFERDGLRAVAGGARQLHRDDDRDTLPLRDQLQPFHDRRHPLAGVAAVDDEETEIVDEHEPQRDRQGGGSLADQAGELVEPHRLLDDQRMFHPLQELRRVLPRVVDEIRPLRI